MNITSGSQHSGGWRQFWSEWDWDDWIKPQIDASVAIGANCLRFIGNSLCVIEGDISLGQYLTQWEQVVDYAAELGVNVFPCCDDVGHFGLTTYDDSAALARYAEIATVMASLGAALAPHGHVIGIDVTNEACSRWPDNETASNIGVLLDALALFVNALRANTTKALTNSRTAHTPERWDSLPAQLLDPLCDFISVHSYYTPSPSDLATLKTKAWGKKPILIGEFGANFEIDSAARTARYEAFKTLIEGDTQIRGGLAWAGYDTNSTDANKWGMFDASDNSPRTDITSVFSTFPTTR